MAQSFSLGYDLNMFKITLIDVHMEFKGTYSPLLGLIQLYTNR